MIYVDSRPPTEQGFKECQYWNKASQEIIDIMNDEPSNSPYENTERELKSLLYGKEPGRDVKHEIGRLVCSFLNTHGGVILVGVDDHGKVLGIEKDLQLQRFETEKRQFDEIRDSLLKSLENLLEIGEKKESFKQLREYIKIELHHANNEETKLVPLLQIIVRAKYLDKEYKRLVYFDTIPYERADSTTKKISSQSLTSFLENSEKERNLPAARKRKATKSKRGGKKGVSQPKGFTQFSILGKKISGEVIILLFIISLTLMFTVSQISPSFLSRNEIPVPPVVPVDSQQVSPEPVIEPAEPVIEPAEPVVEPVAQEPEPVVPEPKPTISITSIEIIFDVATVSVSIDGNFDHWHISIDDVLNENGPAGGYAVSGFSYALTDLPSGRHTICVGATDSSNILLGEQVCESINVQFPTISITSISVNRDDIGVAVAIGDFSYRDALEPRTIHFWSIALDNRLNENGPAGGIKVNNLYYTFNDVMPGEHMICVGITDDTNTLLGEQVCASATVELQTLTWSVESVQFEGSLLRGNRKMIVNYLVTNPNLISVTITNVEIDVTVMNFEITKETTVDSTSIDAKSSKIVTSVIEFTRVEGLRGCCNDQDQFLFDGKYIIESTVGSVMKEFRFGWTGIRD